MAGLTPEERERRRAIREAKRARSASRHVLNRTAPNEAECWNAEDQADLERSLFDVTPPCREADER